MVEFFTFIILFSAVKVRECSLTKFFLHFWLKLGRTCLSVPRYVETILIYWNMDLQLGSLEAVMLGQYLFRLIMSGRITTACSFY